ncbi:cyclic AMP response element-binding protein A isoform X1 [Coccinella septempunctata]|uniref:cyclic AMP response element-binding protein A isoform X1 n=1 Tax=Coccinella septempunctata TaxID=41139 RepID=UPI001D09641D|nr:cyclic AMP response element-binding protein A isoform X1 [Coccinella septempunctata]
METFAIDKPFCDIVSSDELRELWETDLDPTMQDVLRLHSSGDLSIEWTQCDKEIPAVIIHDKLMTDAAFGHTTMLRPIKNEHSYSLNSEGGSLPDSPQSLRKDGNSTVAKGSVKTEKHKIQNATELDARLLEMYGTRLEMFFRDMEDECFPAISMKKACGKLNDMEDEVDEEEIEIKDEPMSESESVHSSCPSSPQSVLPTSDLQFNIDFKESQNLLRQSGLVISSPNTVIPQRITQIPKLSIRFEPSTTQNFQLPPTPPSCSSSSDDSEDNVTVSPAPVPKKSSLVSTARLLLNHHTTRQPIHTHLISTQPKGSTGTLILTEEEKRTLIAEGYPVPTRLPLSKAEEKSLKKIRRKIKNKISAQESRRKKKEYMDQLERKVGLLVTENSEYRKKIEEFQDANTTLLAQLQKLQAIVAKTHPHLKLESI